MHKRLSISFGVLAALFLALFISPTSAFASTYKCSSSFCVQVDGKGTHVDTIQFSIEVSKHSEYYGYFEAYTTGYNYDKSTGNYDWKNGNGNTFSGDKQFYTVKYKINRTFANNTHFTFKSYPVTYGSQKYAHTITSVTIHK